MVGGAIATAISLMGLSWTRELVTGFLGLFGAPQNSHAVEVTAIVFAVIMIYVLDFSINVVQAASRAFIVDNAPAHQQSSANAWAMRIAGIGHIIGYLVGYVDLPKYFWVFGHTQFKILCVFASLAMVMTVTVSCLSIQERDARLDGSRSEHKNGILSFFGDLYRSIRKLSPQIRKVCQVQFFAWIGWFPFLFYITTYIGEIYVQPYFAANPHMTEDEIDEVWQRATRSGTFALFVFAITTFAASVLMPLVVADSFERPERTATTSISAGPGKMRMRDASTKPSRVSGSGYSTSNAEPTIFQQLFSRFRFPQIPWLTLPRAWLLSHFLFALLMWITLFVRTTASATILVALIGIPWAMTNWAPFALIASEISKRDDIRRSLQRSSIGLEDEPLPVRPNDIEDDEQAGVVLGIHNVAISAPQVIATLVSSAIFNALQKPRGSAGDESVAWVLRFGGIAALVAAWLTRQMSEGKEA